MASGSDGGWGRGHFRRRRMAELKDKRDRLQEDIDELRDEIHNFEEGYAEHIDNYETVLASKRAKLDRLEDKRDALQKDINAL